MTDYIYKLKRGDPECSMVHKVSETTHLADVHDEAVANLNFVDVYDISGTHVYSLTSQSLLEEWRDARARGLQWLGKDTADILQTPIHTTGDSKPQKDHINPSHYKSFVGDMQWIETQQYRSRDFFAAVKMQAEKYLDRCGQKDDPLQELLKAKWYLDFLIAWEIEGGAPIMVEHVKTIIEDYLAEGQFK